AVFGRGTPVPRMLALPSPNASVQPEIAPRLIVLVDPSNVARSGAGPDVGITLRLATGGGRAAAPAPVPPRPKADAPSARTTATTLNNARRGRRRSAPGVVATPSPARGTAGHVRAQRNRMPSPSGQPRHSPVPRSGRHLGTVPA